MSSLSEEEELTFLVFSPEFYFHFLSLRLAPPCLPLMLYSCVIISLIFHYSAVAAGGVVRVLLCLTCCQTSGFSSYLGPEGSEELWMQIPGSMSLAKTSMQNTGELLNTAGKTMANLPWHLGWYGNLWSGELEASVASGEGHNESWCLHSWRWTFHLTKPLAILE